MKMPAKHNDISPCVINEQDVSPELDKAIRETLVICFPADCEYFGHQSWWHCVPIYRVLGRDDKGSVAAHVAVVERTVIVGHNLSKVRVAGIQSCCVLPGYRGTGLSDKMMSIAMAEADERGFDAGLLYCLDRFETVYGRMGWHKLNAAAVYVADDKGGKTLIPAKNITMFYPLKAKQFPAGDIDLAGTDW
jgi:GNAT superfamily N-acetyltransferase